MTELVALLGLALALLGVLVVGLLRSHAEILRRLHHLGVRLDSSLPADTVTTPPAVAVAAPPVAAQAAVPDAHDVTGVTPSGEAAAIGIVGASYDTLLAFLSVDGQTCGGFWKTFSDVDRLGLPPRTRLLVVIQDADGESPSAVASLASPSLTIVVSNEAWERYGVPQAPYFVLVGGPSGRVAAHGTGDSWDEVRTGLGRRTASRP